jgi:hypothetical protein
VTVNFSDEIMEELDRLLAGEREARHVLKGREKDVQEAEKKRWEAECEVRRWADERDNLLQKMVSPQ